MNFAGLAGVFRLPRIKDLPPGDLAYDFVDDLLDDLDVFLTDFE